MEQIKGKASLKFEKDIYIMCSASVVGKKEGEGPLNKYYDLIVEDPTVGKDTWEEGESELINKATGILLRKSKLKSQDIRYIFGGDLLGQLIATTFGIKSYDIPLFGLYGACSTAGEAVSLGAMTVGGGAFILSKDTGNVRIKGITTGKIVDYGVKDSLNMGACMAPAAADVIYQNLTDFQVKPDYYDKIITGDLGKVGSEILLKLLGDNNIDISKQHMDCGIEIYDLIEQDTHSGGSGCGCSAVTLAGMILCKMKEKKWNRVLFIPTGALLSTVSYNEGQTVPGIAHGIVLENRMIEE